MEDIYKVYVCGPTVYNDVHIGNMRPIITMDLILKAARFLGIKFEFVHNITDIDDKIINKALSEKVSENEIATRYGNKYLELLKDFNVDTISKIEYVTENLNTINDFIQELINSENAYYDEQKNIWFDVAKNKANYGQVSNQKLDNMQFEDQSYQKRFPADFALWKNTNVGITYKLGIGTGRPGWHTECAALIYKNFGNAGVDVHGGGMDLTFPHHENENIQYLALTNQSIAKEWLRTGQINLNGEKMSKSLQNVILAKDFLNQYPADYLKTIFLLNSFTGLINIDDNLLNNVTKLHKKIKKIYFNAALQKLDVTKNEKTDIATNILRMIFERKFSNFNKSVNDLIKKINTENNPTDMQDLITIFNQLGYQFKDFEYSKFVATYQEWKELVAKKDFANADALRDILAKNDLI
ncbi:class I tRNA ligase family protein [Mycoplasma hafezii]|uniref:class I tRNA ligase family protein n=1 Tax=Mycoplasma hafezii TaxID=525886 RepID=UPI003CECD396